jgi:hypothetical protein
VLTRGRTILLALGVFVTYAYFHQGGGGNQDAGFALVRAMVEQRTLKAPAPPRDIADRSRVEAAIDKAPGHPLLAVPFVAVARAGMKIAGADPVSARSLMWLLYLASLLTAALPASLAVLGLLWLSRQLGASEGAALFAALVLGLGTPLTAYATLFWCQALVAALLLFAFMAAVALRDRPNLSHRPEVFNRRRDWLLALVVGLAGGWAAISEYPAAVTAALLSGLALVHVRRDGRRRLLRVAAGISFGALPCVLVLMAYNKAVYGSPFAAGYPVSVAPASALIELPSGSNLGLSLFGEYRGLLLLSPVLITSPLGMGSLLLRPRWKAMAMVCWLVPAYHFLLNSTYLDWFGGASYGPRHAACALPFLAVPLVVLWSNSGWLLRVPLLGAGIYGMASAVLAAAVTAQPPVNQWSPIARLWWANVKIGKFSLHPGSWNWGQRFGLEGHASLLPLLSLWLLAALVWVALPRLPHLRRLRLRRRPAQPAQPGAATVDPAGDSISLESRRSSVE